MAAKKKIIVKEHDGSEHVTEVSNYDAKQTYEDLKAAQSNETSDYVVVIGDVVIDARSVKGVVPAE